LGLNIAGAAFYLTALSARAAPISLLQPLATFGLVVNAVLAVFYLGERCNSSEWLGVFLLFIGIICLGISAESPPVGQVLLQRPRWVRLPGDDWPPGWWGFDAAAGGAEANCCRDAVRVLAGSLLGAGYLSAKTLALAWREAQYDVAALAMAVTAGGLFGGFWMLLRGYYRGRALIVKATNFVTSQLVIGVGGMFCLGEEFPEAPVKFAARSAAYLLILAGFLVGASLHATRSADGNR